MADTITVDGKRVPRIDRSPGAPDNGRCFRCGQISAPEFHDGTICMSSFPPYRQMDMENKR